MLALPPLNALRAFEAAARRGGFAAAAEELNVTPAAIGQQVRQLEALLGVRLFVREGRGLKLTERGASGLERLSQALNLMGQAATVMRDSSQSRTLSLAVPADFASAWLAPRLAEFAATNDIAFTVHTTNQTEYLISGEVDLAVSFGSEPPPGLIADRIMGEVFTPAAAPHLASTFIGSADLDEASLIHDLSQDLDWSDWLAARGAFGVDTSKGLRVADSLTALKLAEAGAGVVLARRSLASDAFTDGRLQVLFADGDMAARPGYYLLTPSVRRPAPAAASFSAWLRAEAARFHDAADEL